MADRTKSWVSYRPAEPAPTHGPLGGNGRTDLQAVVAPRTMPRGRGDVAFRHHRPDDTSADAGLRESSLGASPATRRSTPSHPIRQGVDGPGTG